MVSESPMILKRKVKLTRQGKRSEFRRKREMEIGSTGRALVSLGRRLRMMSLLSAPTICTPLIRPFSLYSIPRQLSNPSWDEKFSCCAKFTPPFIYSDQIVNFHHFPLPLTIDCRLNRFIRSLNSRISLTHKNCVFILFEGMSWHLLFRRARLLTWEH